MRHAQYTKPFYLWVAFCALAIADTTLSLEAEQKPNLIFILTDDQRFDSLGITGDPIVKTPNIDQLADSGVFFANASVNSAICTPSRVCYLLGQYERRHGINFNSGTSMAPEAWAQSYPVILRENGYFTGYIGKNHVPIGKDAYDTGLMDESFDFWYAGHGHIKFYPKRHHDIFSHAKSDTQAEIISEGTLSFLDSKGGFIDGAGAFLENRPVGQPFCLSLAFNIPHGAGTSNMQMLPSDPELYRTTYRDKMNRIPLPDTYIAAEDILQPKLPENILYADYRQNIYDYVNTPETLTEMKVREMQTITGIDRVVGSILEMLEKQGIADNTIIIFSSDHGLMNGEFGLGGKALNYEPCLRVPMIVYDPRLPANKRGRRLMDLVESVDIAPTLLDYAGIHVPDSMQGSSLRRLVEGEPTQWRKYSFAENLWSTYFGNPRIESVRTQDWKYIRYFENDRSQFANVTKKTLYVVTESQVEHYDKWLNASVKGEKPVYEELFHLASDPNEVTNLAEFPAYQDKLQEMREACQRLVTTARGDLATPPATIVVNGIKEGASKKK